MLERQSIAADAGFWTAAARAVAEFATRCGLPQDRLQGLTWIVPNGAHAAHARAGLREACAGGAFIPPRMAPLSAWLGQPLQASVAARAELFSALRGNAWVRAAFGDQPAALWALARGVAQLCEELTWAAVDGEAAFAGRLEAALARHFHRRAARALQPQAQLVLQLWRARRADDRATRALRELDARAHAAASPLVYTSADELQHWEEAFLQRYAQRAPVLLLDADTAVALRTRPLLAAAWPELCGGDRPGPLAQRAAGIGGAALPLTIVRARSLEEEATAVAQQLLDWRHAGVESIALVALDRLTARRARALLERAQVTVRDETGWKLSTTSAAAAVMRWFDLVADDLYWRDLLDWLKSPFTLAGRVDKAAEVALIERAIRAGSTLQGARAIRRALAIRAEHEGVDARGADQLLALIEAQAQRVPRSGSTLAEHARALGAALSALGLRTGLGADPVGREVLRELDALECELAPVAGRATLADFRALLAERFEEIAYVDRQVESQVAMVSLAASHLRVFDAALLIGADAQHLPAVPDERLFMSNAVRAELGLATADAELHRQSAQLAALLATVPRVTATWRTQHGDEPNPISPLLERLQFVAARALADDLLRDATAQEFPVDAAPQSCPAPAAPMLLPTSITASQVQSLVQCPYQFYARRLLNLAELDDVIELPDKRDFGEALHEVLRRFHGEWGAADFSALQAEALAASLRAHARAVFEPQLERTPALLAFQRRFDGLVDGYIEWLRQCAAEGWRWQAAEHTHAQRLQLPDGRQIEILGRLDRIDAHADGRVRVLDYKARAADVLARGLKEAGEDVQLPIYGLLLAQPAAAAYVSFDRAKQDDGGVHMVTPPQPFEQLVERVARRLHDDVQRIAAGAPLPALGVDPVCERCEMRGLCRRDYWTDGAGEAG
jgi:ATP-dependent helicase/nuclease subunit B